MEIIREVTRKELIHFYLLRETQKRRSDISPELLDIDFEDPNSIDAIFRDKILKTGIIPAYKTWDFVRLYKSDLAQCAIHPNLLKIGERVLGNVIHSTEFINWKPHITTSWYDELNNPPADFQYPEKWALILRPATRGEAIHGARWYVEDGSGRSLCFFRSLQRMSDDAFAFAYIAKTPDAKSDFLRNRFAELYNHQSI